MGVYSGIIAGIQISKNKQGKFTGLLPTTVQVNMQSLSGNTALMEASEKNNVKLAAFLINQGANLDMQNYKNRTALLIAAEKGNLEVAKALIDAGAKRDIQTQSGWTALMFAAKQNNFVAR